MGRKGKTEGKNCSYGEMAGEWLRKEKAVFS